ncbi:hypothetical protein [Bradyrhizobium sp. USDA 336]|uniref:hypothetical protein n=1 Tax=Bradyrhizobium sp. USDA 336 TaxID=3156311 RepID=UPI0038378294
MALDSPIPDFTAAVRPVFFQTPFEEFLYATHGGTLFLVNFRGITYGMTCGHVFKDFGHGQLFVTQEKNAKKGSKPAPIAGIYYPSSPVDGAAGTDVQDICVIGFSSDIPADFFKGSVYPLDATTTRASQPGHRLLVAGVLKEKTSIVPPDITIGYCRLEFQDAGYGSSDPILRTAVAEFAAPEFSDITGVSGSPVFDLTANALCGMVVRGGMQGRFCRIHYIDIYDILQFLDGVSSGAPSHSYKTILSL